MFRLTRSKYRALSTLSANFSEAFFISMVIPAFAGGLDDVNYPVVLLGLASTIAMAYASIFFAEKGKL